MPLPLTTAKATKTMPSGKGTYGSKRGRPAKKKAPAKGAKGKKGLPPSFLKNMKKKGSSKK